MYTINVRNVTEALPRGIQVIRQYGVARPSRYGDVLEVPMPVATIYHNPCERVLLLQERDANPFFHLMESLWILAGRSDVEWLAQFNSRMREFSDDGHEFHAPYGHRLRRAFGFDQLQEVAELLTNDHTDRRAVLQIWEAGRDLGTKSKDIPCNDMVFLKVRDGQLHMTVCCRSNDVIWGAYGANAVQFSMIQEYLAGIIGVGVGVYTQVSDSFHVYTDNPQYEVLKELPMAAANNPYEIGVVSARPIMNNPSRWDSDLFNFINGTEVAEDAGTYAALARVSHFHNNWFADVAVPMYFVWKMHKEQGEGLAGAEDIKATDWRMAATDWLTKREVISNV